MKLVTILRIVGAEVNTIGLTSLLDVYENSLAGDTVVIHGNHDIGDNTITLKDGVNWRFIGNPTIASSSQAGTFWDNREKVIAHFSGDVNIENTYIMQNYYDPYDKRIILNNSESRVNGYTRVLEAIFDWGERGSHLRVRNIKNTLGFEPTWVRVGDGGYQLQGFPHNMRFEPLKTTVHLTFSLNRMVDPNNTLRGHFFESMGSWYLACMDANGNYVDISESTKVSLKIECFPHCPDHQNLVA